MNLFCLQEEEALPFTDCTLEGNGFGMKSPSLYWLYTGRKEFWKKRLWKFVTILFALIKFKLTKERSRRYTAHTITDADYTDDIALLANTPTQAESLLHSLKRTSAGIGLDVNADKMGYMCFNQRGDISTLNGSSLKLVDMFIYSGSSIWSTENDINTRLAKAWTATDRLSVIWKSDLTDEIEHSFFQAAVISIMLYGCTRWTLTKRMEKKLDGNYTRMMRAILNKSWRQHPTQQQLYDHLPPITKTIQVRRTRHVGYSWRSRDELMWHTPVDPYTWTSKGRTTS